MDALWATQSAQRRDDLASTSERLVNCYPEAGAEGGRAGVTIRSVLGLAAFKDLGSVLLRAFIEVDGVFYVAASGSLLSVTAGGVVTTLGAINDDAQTSMSSNGGKVTIAAGGTYYVWNGSTLTTPGSGRLTNVGTVAFHDGYTILTDQDSGEFEWTDLGDPETRDALQFADAESADDKLRQVSVNGREVWLFGEESSEVWRNTGQSGANAFARSAAIDRGILAPGLFAKIADVQVVVTDDGAVNEIAGFRFNPISIPPVETNIAESTPTHVFAYEDRGHKMVVIRYSDRPADVFDLTTRRWHERGTSVYLNEWEVIATERLGATWYAATGAGAIYTLARNNVDAAVPLKRVMRSRPFEIGSGSVDEVELRAEAGTSNLGRAATVALRVSRDGGVTWEPEIWRSLGTQGQYRSRAQWHALGCADDIGAVAFEFSITDPADINMYAKGRIEVSG